MFKAPGLVWGKKNVDGWWWSVKRIMGRRKLRREEGREACPRPLEKKGLVISPSYKLHLVAIVMKNI